MNSDTHARAHTHAHAHRLIILDFHASSVTGKPISMDFVIQFGTCLNDCTVKHRNNPGTVLRDKSVSLAHGARARLKPAEVTDEFSVA